MEDGEPAERGLVELRADGVFERVDFGERRIFCDPNVIRKRAEDAGGDAAPSPCR